MFDLGLDRVEGDVVELLLVEAAPRHREQADRDVGEIEADVRTAEELARVIKIAKCYQEVTENES